MMRTTVTLDPDTEKLLRRRMAERNVSFKQALNDAVRDALGAPDPAPFRTRTHDMGPPTVDLAHTGRLLDDWAVDDFLRLDAELRAERRRDP
jgi:hypothetical protein